MISIDTKRKEISMQVTNVSLMGFQGKSQIAKKAAQAAKELEPNFNEFAYSVPTGKISKPLTAEDAAHLAAEQAKVFIEQGNKDVAKEVVKDTTHDYLSASILIK